MRFWPSKAIRVAAHRSEGTARFEVPAVSGSQVPAGAAALGDCRFRFTCAGSLSIAACRPTGAVKLSVHSVSPEMNLSMRMNF